MKPTAPGCRPRPGHPAHLAGGRRHTRRPGIPGVGVGTAGTGISPHLPTRKASRPSTSASAATGVTPPCFLGTWQTGGHVRTCPDAGLMTTDGDGRPQPPQKHAGPRGWGGGSRLLACKGPI